MAGAVKGAGGGARFLIDGLRIVVLLQRQPVSLAVIRFLNWE